MFQYKLGALLLIIALVAVGSVGFFTQSAQAQEGNAVPATLPLTISVNGQGTAYATPDLAYVSLGVDISNPDVTTAVNDANARVDAITAAVRELGIESGDIRTENFNIYRETFYGPEGPTGDGTFRVSYYLRLTVRNLDQVAEVISAALNAGANSVNGVSFDIADKQAVESEARARAVEDARRDAEELASLMGVSVGQVVSISDIQPQNLPFYNGFGGGGGGVMEQSVTNLPVEPGSLAVDVSVAITFELVR